MDKYVRKPIVMVFAGPNGSGKTTVARRYPTFGAYINADDLKAEYNLTDIEAAQQAEALRNTLVGKKADLSFETVLSTERNLLFLEKAKTLGYEVYCIYVLTCNETINIARVKARHAMGGHNVPKDKIKARYHRALALIPRLVSLCDKMLIYDNSDTPTVIFHKEYSNSEILPSELWSEIALRKLLEQ